MKYYLKFSAIALMLSIFLLGHAQTIWAAADFESSQTVSYQVLESGKTMVRHDVRLTNLTTNSYVSAYSLSLGFSDIKTVGAYDSQGILETKVTSNEDGTAIAFTFNDRVVGKGNVLAFTLSYETNQIALRNGGIWEIVIPGIKDSSQLKTYSVRLSVPESFGKISYIKPRRDDGLENEPLVFDKEDVLKGISLAYGDYQIFDFTLSYHLRNTRLYSILTEIALPPKSAYQDILLSQMSPQPMTVYEDEDGNWLAKYRLEPSEKLDIKVVGVAKIFVTPQEATPISKEMANIYLREQKYWEVHDDQIQEKAKELRSVREIYDYVARTLTYDYNRIEKRLPRIGAASVLAKPQSAICMEFTDLFIALARAAGIEAREVDGFAYTQNTRFRPLSLVKDVLHAWPEYYDKERQVWIAVDPTWGNTSGVDYFDVFDFNHFAFAIKGKDSEYPGPAGSYKEDIEQNDVDVSFGDTQSFVEKDDVRVRFALPDTLASGFPTSGNLVVENNGNHLLPRGQLGLSAKGLVPESMIVDIEPIPPFGKLTVPIRFTSSSYFDNRRATIEAAIAGKMFTRDVRVLPVFLVYLPVIGGVFGGAVVFFVARWAWRVFVQRRKGSNPLRGQSP